MAKHPPAKSLADFKQLSLLGEGAYSAVYKVLRIADREIYALKKVKLPSLSDKEKQNALNEVRLLASVRHESIIGYKEAFFDDKTRCLCIVTEYANSGDLFQQITKCQKERRHPNEADVWRYLHGMCHGLKALHDMRILHRDLKCANVFLHTNPGCETVAKLGDFNVSKVAKRGLCMTQTGTPYYASPEVWRDMPYDAKSDMWSLGCVLYEMVALRPPFRAEDMEGLYRKVLRGQYPRIPQHFSNDLSEVIGVLLQVNPRHRPSMEQLLQMPVMRRHACESLPEHRPADLLSTIKLPKNAIDLSGCLPEPQYDLSFSYDVPPSQESAGDIAGGTAKQPPRAVNALRGQGQPPLIPPPDDAAPKVAQADGYQDSLDAYLSSPPPPDPYSHRAGPPVPRAAPAAQAGGGPAPGQYGQQGQGQAAPAMPPGHLPQIGQDRSRGVVDRGDDSLDAYVQRQQHRPPRQQQRPSGEYDYGMEAQLEQRLPRHASPTPSSQAGRGPPQGYTGQQAYGAQQAYGGQQYRRIPADGREGRDGHAPRRMANYARPQYALGAGDGGANRRGSSEARSNTDAASGRQPSGGGSAMPPRQPTGPGGNGAGAGGALRLPRIFQKAS